MTIVMRPSCWHKNICTIWLSAPAQGLCLNFFSLITADFKRSGERYRTKGPLVYYLNWLYIKEWTGMEFRDSLRIGKGGKLLLQFCNVICGAPTTTEVKGLRCDEMKLKKVGLKKLDVLQTGTWQKHESFSNRIKLTYYFTRTENCVKLLIRTVFENYKQPF